METVKDSAFYNVCDLVYREKANLVHARFNELYDEVLLNENISLSKSLRYGLWELQSISEELVLALSKGSRDADEIFADRILSEPRLGDKEMIEYLEAVLAIIPDLAKKPQLDISAADFGYMMVDLGVITKAMRSVLGSARKEPLGEPQPLSKAA